MKYTAWIGTVASVIGSFLVALGITFIGYSAFFVGALAWCLVAEHRKDYALLLLNAVFLTANIIGLARAF